MDFTCTYIALPKYKKSVIIFIILSLIIQISCKNEEVPSLTTSDVTNITASTAISGGNVISEGSGTIIERGVCWSLESNPSISDNKTLDGAGAGTFRSNITDLKGGSVYFVRAYAKNDAGIGYGMTMSFTTLGAPPTSITKTATNVTTIGATLNGEANANHLQTSVSFEYGTSTSYGNSISYNQNPISDGSSKSISINITGLTPATTYHYRIKSDNSLGQVCGNDMSFTTLGQSPTVTTNNATSITSYSSVINGSVNANHLPTSIIFEYGASISLGNIINATPNNLSGSSATSASANLSGLLPGTTYYYRIKATNSLGSSFGNVKSFSTTNIVSDIDGNTYQTISIGSQIWMTENLKTSKFRNGEIIASGLSSLDWYNNTNGAFTYYNNSETNNALYGKLYNWYAVTNSKQICPTGWHVPSINEWNTLINFLGGKDIAGGKLKEMGINHWSSPNTGATNEYGFTALPGGYCLGCDEYGDSYYSGTFSSFGSTGMWWSSTEVSSTKALYGVMSTFGTVFDLGTGIGSYKRHGMSVRCIKD